MRVLSHITAFAVHQSYWWSVFESSKLGRVGRTCEHLKLERHLEW